MSSHPTTRDDMDPAGQTCGFQVGYGLPWNEYCAKPKARGLYWCAEHHQVALEEDASAHPPGATVGE